MLEERFQSSAEKAYIASLDNALTIILGKLAKIESVDEVKRLNALKALIEKEISGLYEDIKPYVKDDMEGFAQFDYKTQFNYLNETASLGYTFAAIPKDTMKQILSFDDVMVLNGKGYTLNELFNKASNAQISKYKEIISGGLGANDGYSNIAKSLKEAGAEATLNMRTLVQTAVGEARDRANIYTYDNVFADVIIGWKSVAVLDSRTSLQCFDESTVVHPIGELQSIFKRKYVGEVITITTSTGKKLTGTPNHPILTSVGWLPLNKIKPNEHVVYSVCTDSFMVFANENICMPSPIGKLFNSLNNASISKIESKSSSTIDFHGDGMSSDEKIHILHPKRLLWCGFYPKFGHQIKKSFFSLCHSSAVFSALRLINNRLFSSKIVSVMSSWLNRSPFEAFVKPTFRPVFIGKSLQNIRNVFSTFVKFNNNIFIKLYRLVFFPTFKGWHYSEIFKKASNGGSGSVISPSDITGRFSVPIREDYITRVDREFRSFHVYNLECDTGLYHANGIIVKNCAALDGIKYMKPKYSYATIPNRPKRHFNCRSILRPITTFDTVTERPENGDKTGQIDSDITFKDWFTTQSAKFQKEYLGDARYKLYKDERLSIKSFVDVKDGRRFTIKELNEKF